MIDLLRQRLPRHPILDARAEEQAIKEILQEVALYALWRAGFFEVAAFQGGTSLRILHGLPRFSEDLDFILAEPDPDFAWSRYFDRLTIVLAEFGIRCALIDRGRMGRALRQALLKDDSIGRQLDLSFYGGDPHRTLKIKLEIDTHPPQGSGFEYRYFDFPLDFEVRAQDLPSNFALKLHALLCRPYVKGRDWFDFGWYVARGVTPNLPHLQNALRQIGPWANENPAVDALWLENALTARIQAINWVEAARDVAPFLAAAEQHSLKLWSPRFFTDKAGKLARAMISA